MSDTKKAVMTYQEEKAILIYLSEMYCKAQTLMSLYESSENVHQNAVKLGQQAALVNLFDLILRNCTPETRFIIIHTYIRKDGNDWYIPYYSESTYYRLRKNAVHEFTSSFRKLRD